MLVMQLLFQLSLQAAPAKVDRSRLRQKLSSKLLQPATPLVTKRIALRVFEKFSSIACQYKKV